MLCAQHSNFTELFARKFEQLKSVGCFLTSMLRKIKFDGKNGWLERKLRRICKNSNSIIDLDGFMHLTNSDN